MPALPSFINYKSGRKAKTIKSPFSLLRGEPSTSTATANLPRNYLTTEVIDIHDQTARYSLDFDGGKPIDDYENPIVDQEPPYQGAGTSSPQVQLDIDFSQALTDWFPPDLLQSEQLNGVAEGLKPGGSGLRNEVANTSASTGGLGFENGRDSSTANDDEDGGSSTLSSSEDIIANLRAMNPSHFGKLPGYDDFNRLEQPSKSPQKNIPNSISIKPNRRPISPVSSPLRSQRLSLCDTPTSSAVSGTTFARALLSNSFILTDNRSSRYRSGVVGLTRSDSTTLPRAEHSFGAAYNDDRFSIGSDAPPIPSNASFLYEPPKKPRTAAAELREKRKQNLRRRSSTGSLAARVLPETPTPSTRPSSALLSPGVEFDITSLLPKSPEPRKTSPLPRSPLPPTPKLAFLPEDDNTNSSKRESGPDEYQEVTQRFPMDSQLLSPDLDMQSPTASSEDLQSAKNLEDVLNYYSLPDSPAPLLMNANYRPAFSPISEESSSQLSPPTPYKNDKRESQRNIPIGARSPLSGTPRVRGESVLLPRRLSDGRQSRQPPGERPNSVTQPPSPSHAQSSSSFASVGSDLLSPLTPPQLSTIFNRQRSGSAPSPIKVVRDSRDANAYKITVTPRNDPDTPSTDEGLDGGGNVVLQEFPETPNMFSPMFTGGASGPSSMGQESMAGPGRLDVAPMPTVPMSATVSRVTSQPSLAQQILLNRAGTTVRHSRQSSISKIKTNGLGGRSGSPSNRRLLDISDIASASNTANVEAASSSSMSLNVPQDPVPELSVTSAEHAPTGDLLSQSPVELTAGGSINGGMSAVDLSRPPSRGTIMTQGSDASSMYTSSSERRLKSLPSIPVSPSTPGSLGSVSGSLVPPPVVLASITSVASQNHPSTTPSSTLAHLPAILTTTNATPNIPPPPTIPPPSPTPSQKARALPPRGRLPPALTITSSAAESTVAVNGDPNGENSPASLGEPSVSTGSSLADGNPNGNLNVSQNATAIAPNQTSSLTYKDDFTGRASDIFRGTSLGSPPPYYTVVSEAIAQAEHNATNHTLPPTPQVNEAVALESFQFSGQPTGNSLSTTPGPAQLEWSQSAEFHAPSLLARESSTMSQRSRMRPPLPAGPRRPSQVSTVGSSSGLFAHQRDRAGSVSSLNSNHLIQVVRRGREAESVLSPQFQTPSPKWRGYTMEIAKWTFTSAQLQAIVSKAIQQSAQASSIRLLRLEVLENELPEEMQRLEAQRTDLKARYKMLTRRRATVLDALSSHMTDWDGENSTHALRLVENLKEISSMLDHLAEELHSVDGQLAHLDSMTHIHTGSALSMALRKLNASFLKQVAENQSLIKKIQILEAERDEGWRQAECEANEFDRMSDRDRADGPSSKRSSRVSAIRKSSSRASRAGLRTPSQRFSQASSLGSSGMQSFALTPSRSPLLRLEEIPPVPPIPRRRPLDIRTHSPLRSSPALSTSGVTPTSENRALAKAQDDLYAMLGITNPEPRLRRSSSASALRSPSLGRSDRLARPSNLMPSDDGHSSWRRSSLPPDSQLADVYNAMEADRNAVLATIDVLSSDTR